MKTMIIGDGYVATYFEKFPNTYDVIAKEYIFEIDKPINIFDYDTVVNCYESKEGTFEELYENNVKFPIALYNLCKAFDKKFVQISTADLYMGNFDWRTTTENDSLNIKTDYLLTKRVAEKRLENTDSLILRIKNTFDGRYHDDNWLIKAMKRKKVYNWIDTRTYLPDLQTAIEKLVDKKLSGIFNIVQSESNSDLFYFKEILKLHAYSKITANDIDNDVEFHADVNSTKLQSHITLTSETFAVIASWEEIVNTSTSIMSNIYDDMLRNLININFNS